ncbi:unnamed protein product, partial [Sphacelaria rigidula]
MSADCKYEERAVLEKSHARLFDLVRKEATAQQWARWLRVPLEHAAAAGDAKLVNDLLAAGASPKPSWKGSFGRSLLCAAVQGGNHEVVSKLLIPCANPDVNVLSGRQSLSPLHHAASDGHESIAKLLLLAGADVDIVDSKRSSPLLLAVRG